MLIVAGAVTLLFISFASYKAGYDRGLAKVAAIMRDACDHVVHADTPYEQVRGIHSFNEYVIRRWDQEL